MRRIIIHKRFNSFSTKLNKTTNTIQIVGRVCNKQLKYTDTGMLYKNDRFFFNTSQSTYLFRAQFLKLIDLTRFIYFQKLTLNGIGYRCYKITNKLLVLKIGFTHRFYYKILYNNVFFACKKVKLIFYGNFLDPINVVSYNLKALRWPNAYSSKGVKFTDEFLKKKPGKKRT